MTATIYVCIALTGVCLMVSGAPLSGDKLEENRDKRSGEVIFFENAQNGVDNMSKRSRTWPAASEMNSNNEHPSVSVQAQPQKTNQEKPPLDEKTDLEETYKEFTEELEEQAFYEALDFLVDRLVSEAYEDEELAKEFGLNTAVGPQHEEVQEDTTIFNEATDDPSAGSDDKEEDELATLIKQQNQMFQPKQSAKQSSSLSVEMRADSSADSDKMSNLGEQDKNFFNNDFLKAWEEEQDRQRAKEGKVEETTPPPITTPEYFEDANEEINGDGFTFNNVEDYLNYLQTLKTLEDKLQAELKKQTANQDQEQQEDDGENRHTRKRRSLTEWMDEEPINEKGGIYFSPQEVSELKSLLLELAEQRLQSEQIIDTLIKEENEMMDEEAQLSYFGGDNYKGGYGSEDEDDDESAAASSKLDDLALMLNNKPVRPPSYQPYQNYKRSGYVPYFNQIRK